MNTITVQANDLANALRHGVAAARSPHPALQHVRLHTSQGGPLKLETTDTEVWVQARIPAQCTGAFDLMLRDDLLRPVAAAGGQLDIHPDGKIRGTHGRWAVPALASEIFPDADGADAWQQVKSSRDELHEAIAAASYSADEDGANATLRGVFVVPGAVWSTDGKQMGFVATDYDGPRFGIPSRQVPRVLQALQQEEATVHVANVRQDTAGLLRITGPDLEVTLRLLPPATLDMTKFVRGVDPGPCAPVLRRGPLLAALRRFMPFIAYKTGRVNGKPAIPHARLVMHDGVLTLSDRTGEFSENLVDTVFEGADDSNWSMSFDIKRLQLSLGAMDAETITFYPGARNGDNPLVAITPHGSTLKQVAHLLALITE